LKVRRGAWLKGILLLVAVGLASPAEARARKKRKRLATAVVAARPEDDVRKRGSSPAFRKATVRLW